MIQLITTAIFDMVIPVVAVAVFAALVGLLIHRSNQATNVATKKRGRILVWATALGASTVLAIVVVLTQVPFYEDLFKNYAKPLPDLLPWLNLVFLTPIALESLAWVFTVMSVFAVVNNKPSARYERLMWAFSSIAGIVNAGHNISSGQAITGIVLGGFSIAGPLLVHYALRWDRDAQSDWSADDFRRSAIARAIFIGRRTAQIVRHPINSWRTISIATNLGCTWDQAYRIALLGQYDAVHQVLAQQFERSLPKVDDTEIEAAPEGVHDGAPDVVHGGAHAKPQGVHTELFPGCTDPVVHDLDLVHDTSALFASWGVHDPVREDGAHPESSTNTSAPEGAQDAAPQGVHEVHDTGAPESAHPLHPVHDDTVHTPTDDGAPASAPGGAHPDSERAHTGRADGAPKPVQAHAERQEHVAARHWWHCTNNGTDPRARTRRETAEHLGINPTAVTRGFKLAETGEFPNPNPDGTEGSA